MKLVAKYYTIYKYHWGCCYPTDWYYQSLVLAKKDMEDEIDDWIIDEVTIYFHDDGRVTIDEKTVLKKGE